ncbi:hypothetical protein KZZ04_20020, partial [Pseudoalteromonas sp. CR1]|nr:hypothetical protein [Pseudoalteromonas sp. CR1]
MRCKRRLVRDDAGTPSCIVGVAFDVTVDKAQEARLAHAAQTDALTGLANRREFDLRADLAWQLA